MNPGFIMHLPAKLDRIMICILNIIVYEQDWPRWRHGFTDLRDEGHSIQPHLSTFMKRGASENPKLEEGREFSKA